MAAEERRKVLKVGDPEYAKKIEMIPMIPSNKIDDQNLNNYTSEDMRDFELRHLRELTEQAANMDIDEQIATAAGLRIEILFNAVGDYITRQQENNRTIETLKQQ